MKLMDEQRVSHIRGKHRTAVAYQSERIDLSVEELGILLSSEQAWKEEAERKDGKIKTYDYNYQRVLKQINQAIEVLKWYANNEFWKTEVINVEDVNYKARRFLSSLQEDKP